MNYLQDVSDKGQQQNQVVDTSNAGKGILPGDNPKDQPVVVLNSGIKGKVMFTSCSGIAPQGQNPVCNKYSGPLTFSIKNDSNGVVRMVTADKNGDFNEKLEIGNYTVNYSPSGKQYSQFTKTVKVTKDKYTNLDIDITVLNQ